ncbi:cytochrome P450 [Flavobacterium sp. MC2016-06]|uniref:cytochrome P450 n=1 Tax=Flavobacterium sp. MC2016-06 TaxID=2676308 RepID=UPI0012BB16A8|nr:cytochrome P450 [Flavobacterium sp. MC2016-06]MBU3862094.1 cytochrome P450 [Flavobacterium sp. MC2016-06]
MTALFLQSEIENPYSFYQKMIEENPVYWDETNQIWALYSYEYCLEILNNTNAHIPAFAPNPNLNEYASRIISNLARLSNGIQHEISKETAGLLFSYMKTVGINSIMEELLQENLSKKINWVDLVCKKLPILTVLKSFDFNEVDSLFISENITVLVKIMQPNKTEEDVELINTLSEEIYLITEKHITELPFYESLINRIAASYSISSEETISICISNLIGLFIQSYDACRGLLSNSLLQILSNENSSKKGFDKIWIQKMVVETLRFDPPIHNTRRIAVADIQLNGITIKKNDPILVVLAGANRDLKQFINPMLFDIERNNSAEHLTFGIGGHECLAKYFSIDLAADALLYLLANYKNISILENKIEYEPMINARLPKAIWISLL